LDDTKMARTILSMAFLPIVATAFEHVIL
jgi:hypothetical protein